MPWRNVPCGPRGREDHHSNLNPSYHNDPETSLRGPYPGCHDMRHCYAGNIIAIAGQWGFDCRV